MSLLERLFNRTPGRFFVQLRQALLDRYGTSIGNEKNVHRSKAGPGRMPPHRHRHKPAGTKVLRKFEGWRA